MRAKELQFTGERFTPECEREIWYEHMHRYSFALQWCKDQKVLDAACGEGYGSALLARTAVNVTGVDLSNETIDHARRRYGTLENLRFERANCSRLPFDDGVFDRIVSFETLEHLEEHEAMLAEFRRVLSPAGCVLLSSPDKATYADQQGFKNEFHVRELYREELESLVSEYFPAYRLYGQKLMFHSVIWSMDDVEKVAMQRMADGKPQDHDSVVPQAMYYIAVCASNKEALPVSHQQLWLFDDAEESVYQHYLGEIRRNMAAGAIIADRDREIEALKSRIDQQHKQEKRWWHRLLGKG